MNYSDYEFEDLQDLKNDPNNYDPFGEDTSQDVTCIKCHQTGVWQGIGDPPADFICPCCR